MKLYKAHNFVQFWRRDSRTIEAAQKRVNKAISERETIYSPTLMSVRDIIYFICACKFIKRALESLYFVLFKLGSVFTIPLGKNKLN